MKKILNVLIIFTLAFISFDPVFAKEKIELSMPEAGVYIFKINTNKYGEKIKPHITRNLTTTKRVYNDNCYDLVVNGGFFDVQNGKSVSYVTIDEKLAADVEKNTELVNQLKKEGRLDSVLLRSEFRILENEKGKLKFDIALHNEKVKDGWKIKHALQAGPMLLPELDLAKEGFVIYEDDMVKFQSVDILKRRERTMLALKGKYLYIVIFTKDHKADANEMRDYLKNNLKVDKAIALDGGLSTSINYKDISIGSLGKYQRRVKSFLVIER